MEGLEDRGEGDLGLSHKSLGELQFPFCANISSQRQNAWVLTFWILPHQRLERLLAVENLSNRLQSVKGEQNWRKQLGGGSRRRTAGR